MVINTLKEYKVNIFLNFKNTFYYMGGNLLQFLISIFTLPIYSKYLDPEQFAILGYFTAINAFFMPLFDLNLSTYYLNNYYSPKTINKNEELSYTINILNISNIVIGFLGYFIMFAYFNAFNVQFPIYPYLIIVLIYLFFNKYRVFYLLDCRIQKKGLYYFLLSATTIIFNAIFSLFLVIELRAGAAGKLGGPLISQLIITIIIIAIWLRNKKFRFYLNFKKEKIIDSIKFIWPLLIASYSYFPIANMDKIFLERLHNPTEFGIYNVGFIVSTYVGVFFLALYQSFEPDLYRFIHNDKFKKYMIFFIGYSFVLIFVSACFFSFSDIILSVLTSGRYTSASGYANVFIIGIAFTRIGGLFEPIFNAARQTKYILITNILVGIFSIICYYFMIEWKEFEGANISRVLIGLFYIITSTTLYYYYRYKKHRK